MTEYFYYKYIPYKKAKRVDIVVSKTEDSKVPNIDVSRLVILGGEFKKIGDKDEIIGGGNQKVGSANKR